MGWLRRRPTLGAHACHGPVCATAAELHAHTKRQEERLRLCPDVDVLLGVQHAAAGQRLVLSRLEEIHRIVRQEVG